MWVNMPCMDGNGKGNVSIGVWRFQQHVRGGHIWGGNSLNWNLFGHSECLFGIIHQFQTKAIKLVTSTRKIWYSQIRSLPRFFGGGPKKKTSKIKTTIQKKNRKDHPKKNQPSYPYSKSKVLNNKTPKNGQPIHKPSRRPRLMSLWFFPLLDQNLCHPHHSWHHPTTCSPKQKAVTTVPPIWDRLKISQTQGVWCIS